MSLPPKIKPSSIVNAYLYYAQRLLQFQNSNPNISSDADKLVFNASVCLCLKQAWQAWLDELGRYLNKNLKEYSDLLLAEHRAHPEVQALLDIQQQADNWLTPLILCLEPLVQTSARANDEINPIPGRIQALQLDSAESHTVNTQPPQTVEQFNRLIEGFKEHIRLVRNRQEEW